MGRRGKSDVSSVVDDGIESDGVVEYTYHQPTETVMLQSKYPARIKQTGQMSGKQYVWEKAGAIVEVDAVDAESLLAKKMGGKACCGSKNNNYLFILV